jgi:hypothetical protein
MLSGSVFADVVVSGRVGDVWDGAQYDYGTSNQNLPSPGTLETGDYDFDGTADDRRLYRPIGTQILNTLSVNPFAGGSGDGKTTVYRLGAQLANLNTSTDPALTSFRFEASLDGVRLIANNPNIDRKMAYALTVDKDDFLVGSSGSETVSFLNSGTSMSVNLRTLTSDGDGNARFIVQDGSNWYVSQTATNSTSGDAWSLNPFTESWHTYDPSTNLFLDTTSLGGTVLGSTFTDIQSWGVLMQTDTSTSSASNTTPWFQADQLFLDATVIPEPSSLLLLLTAMGGLSVLRLSRARTRR